MGIFSDSVVHNSNFALIRTFALLKINCVLAIATCVLVLTGRVAAQDLAAFEKHLTEYHMANGLTFLIYERSEAPVVSFFTSVNVGSGQEVPGITGLAHMLEHMAFKGTDTVGTTNYAAEKVALQKVEDAYAAYD